MCSFTYGIAEKPYETGDQLAVDYEREEYYEIVTNVVGEGLQEKWK